MVVLSLVLSSDVFTIASVSIIIANLFNCKRLGLNHGFGSISNQYIQYMPEDTFICKRDVYS